MKPQPWPARLHALDVSRGFAALSVVLWHWQHFAFVGDLLPAGFDRQSQPFYQLLRLFYEEGALGVDYFFILSGFIFFWLYREGIGKKAISLAQFWINRLSRLYPLHLVTLLGVALMQVIYTRREGIPFIYNFNDLHHFLLNLGFASAWGFERGFSFNLPTWSVSVEILCYYIFFVVAYFRLGNPLTCLVLSIVSFAFYQARYVLVLQGLALFFLGGLVYHLTRLVSSRLTRLRFLIYGICIASWAIVLVNAYLVDLGSLLEQAGSLGKYIRVAFPDYVLFPATVSSLALIEINRGHFMRSIAWIGNITYSSYLLHFPLQLIFALALSFGVLPAGFYRQPVWLVVFLILLIALSFLAYHGFERPLQKKLREIFLKTAPG